MNPRRRIGHQTRSECGERRAMRLLYVIITVLLVASLGLLEAVTP
jgi:hypothetical protein